MKPPHTVKHHTPGWNPDMITVVTPEMRALARRALVALEARKDEDIDLWSRRLVASVLSISESQDE